MRWRRRCDPDRTELGRPLAHVAEELCGIADPAERRAVRLALREERLLSGLEARLALDRGRPGDARAGCSGGSLLTATLLLLTGGQADRAVLTKTALTLPLFVGGTI